MTAIHFTLMEFLFQAKMENHPLQYRQYQVPSYSEHTIVYTL